MLTIVKVHEAHTYRAQSVKLTRDFEQLSDTQRFNKLDEYEDKAHVIARGLKDEPQLFPAYDKLAATYNQAKMAILDGNSDKAYAHVLHAESLNNAALDAVTDPDHPLAVAIRANQAGPSKS